MQKSISTNWETIKHILYLISMILLSGLSILIFAHSTCNFSLLSFIKTVMSERQLFLTIIFGAATFACVFLFIGKLLSKLSSRNQLLLTIIIAALGMILQYFLLFHLQSVLRYDHLRVFDGGLEILNTGKLSLTANDGYFGLYPFNISVAYFNSIILRMVSLLGIPEKYFLLSLQCVYLFLIDLGVFFSWQIVRMLHSIKNATLFAILCAANPLLYVCAAGCYTTTLMLPLLMGTMLFILYFLKEQDFRKKCLLGFLAGAALAFGSRLRATVFIAGIALCIYLIIRKRSEDSTVYSSKRIAALTLSVLLGCVISFGGYTLLQNTCITEDYTDTQMPAIYYLMFAANPESKGTYNEDDFGMISQYDTLEEKKESAFQVLKERITSLGISGTLSLADHKLQMTWSDGIDDYRDFLITSRNYGTLQSFIAGDHKDFFALYCHIYHVAVMAMFCIAVIFALKRSCDSYYLIFLTLLGGMIFHIFWESYYIYSFGFSMLLAIPASESLCVFSEKRYATHTAGGLGILTLAGLFFILAPAVKEMSNAEYRHNHYAVVQDMSLGECQPLLSGEVITQTFKADLPFNRLGCKVYNNTSADNDSIYCIELLSEANEVLASRDFIGAEAENGGYCYLEFDPVIPVGEETYQIRLTPLHTTDENHLMFGYYNTHQFDIYSDGFMSGLNSDERSDLAFMVFFNITSGYFH